MTIELNFRDPATNSIAIPVDGTAQTFELTNLPENSLHQFHIIFSDSAVFDPAALSTPTGGNIVFEAAVIAQKDGVVDSSYWEPTTNGAFAAADVYTARPLSAFIGLAKSVRLTLDQVVGVTHAYVVYAGLNQ